MNLKQSIKSAGAAALLLLTFSCRSTTDADLVKGALYSGVLPANNIKVENVAAGDFHSFFLTASGEMYAAGDNRFGQLGLGDLKERHAFTKVSGDFSSHVKSITADSEHSLLLTTSGDVYTTGEKNPLFTKVPDIHHVTNIVSGNSSDFLITDSGEVYAMGINSAGQLGLGDTQDRDVFTKVPGVSHVKSIAAGDWHSLLLTTSGEVYATGGEYHWRTRFWRYSKKICFH